MQGQDLPLESIFISDSESCMQLRQCKHGRPHANAANHGNSAELRTDLGSKCYFTSRKVALKMEYKLEKKKF